MLSVPSIELIAVCLRVLKEVAKTQPKEVGHISFVAQATFFLGEVHNFCSLFRDLYKSIRKTHTDVDISVCFSYTLIL